jgi:hypothetical protein
MLAIRSANAAFQLGDNFAARVKARQDRHGGDIEAQ